MDISKEISADIIKYLQEKKGQSVDDIATNMSTSSEFIQFVIKKQLNLTPKHINTYLKTQKIAFWEFAIEVIPENHLPKSIVKKIQLCKQISEYLKKVKKIT